MENKKVFSFRQNDVSDTQSVMSCGRLLQSVGPAAANARSPTVRWWVRGTSSCSEDVAAMGHSPSDEGHWISTVGRDRAVTETPSSLACTRCAQKNTASELASMSVILPERHKPVIDLAAAFITDCNTRVMPHSQNQINIQQHSYLSVTLTVCVPHTAWTISRSLGLHKCVGQ